MLKINTGDVRQLLSFTAVGGIGFIIDAGVLTVLMGSLGLNLYLSRLASFSCACSATWLLNRNWVFRTETASLKISKTEYSRYVAVQIGGALTNLGIFVLAIKIIPPLIDTPIVPLAVGAAFGLAFNFSGARLWVYPKQEKIHE